MVQNFNSEVIVFTVLLLQCEISTFDKKIIIEIRLKNENYYDSLLTPSKLKQDNPRKFGTLGNTQKGKIGM